MYNAEYLKKVFLTLKMKGIVSTQQEFAESFGSNKASMSLAMKGDPKYLTNSFVKRMLAKYPQLNAEYLKTGKGGMFIDGDDVDTNELPMSEETFDSPSQTYAYDPDMVATLMDELKAQRQLTENAQAQANRALAQVDQLVEIIKNIAKK